MKILQCEYCEKFFECEIHDKVCENLQFLQNFLDIEESEDIAKYCKSFNKIDIRELWRVPIQNDREGFL